MKSKKNAKSRTKERELIMTVSLFLVGREELRKLFWNIKNVKYIAKEQVVEIGVSTISGKLGTTLEKLRKTCKPLSEYLYENGLTFRKSRIHFYVDKREEEVAHLTNLINSLETKI